MKNKLKYHEALLFWPWCLAALFFGGGLAMLWPLAMLSVFISLPVVAGVATAWFTYSFLGWIGAAVAGLFLGLLVGGLEKVIWPLLDDWVGRTQEARIARIQWQVRRGF